MNVLLSRQSCCFFPSQRRRGLQRVTLSSPTSSPDFQTLGRCSSIRLTFLDTRQIRKKKKNAKECLHQQAARRHRFPRAVICGSRCLIVVTGSFLISSVSSVMSPSHFISSERPSPCSLSTAGVLYASGQSGGEDRLLKEETAAGSHYQHFFTPGGLKTEGWRSTSRADDNITPKRSSLARNDRRKDTRVERLRNQQRVAVIALNTTRLQGCAG